MEIGYCYDCHETWTYTEDEYEEIVNTLVNKWKKFLIDKYYYECF